MLDYPSLILLISRRMLGIFPVESAALRFPSFANSKIFLKFFVLLQRYTLECIEFEFYIAIFGVLLTICHLIILTRKTMMTSSIISIMIGLAICDMVSMIVAISIKHLVINFFRDECTPPLTWFAESIFWRLMNFRDDVMRCSAWLSVLMALVRFLALRFVFKPKFQRISNLSFGFYAASIIFLLSSAMALMNSMRFKLVEVGSWAQNEKCENYSNTTWPLHEIRQSDFYETNKRVLLNFIAFSNGAFSRILPCILLPILTCLLILEIRRSRKITSTTSSVVRKNTERTTALVIFMAVSFFIPSLPAGICTILQGLYDDIGFFQLSLYIDHFCNAILTSNASVHCVICFSMSSNYRKIVKKMLRIKTKKVLSTSAIMF